jgi:hypothetical protein
MLPLRSMPILVGALSLLAGCRPNLPADPDAVLYYFRYARVQGEVRRVWPEGQQYVDTVLKADAVVQKSCAPLWAWQWPESLWPREDPRWQDPNEIAAQLTKLDELTAAKTKRDEALTKLQDALEQLPPTLAQATGGVTAFVPQASAALAVDGVGLGRDVRDTEARLTATVAQHLAVYRAAQSATSQPQAAPAAPFDAAYEALAEHLRDNRAQFLSYAAERLAATRTAQADIRAERYRVYGRVFIRKQLEAQSKAIAALVERQQDAIAKLEKQGPGGGAAARLTFLREYVQKLTAARQDLDKRVAEILSAQ